METFPEIINFRITSRCNNNCSYCYGSPKNLEELDFSKLKELFYLFHKNKVNSVVLCGGEPLLREDFGDIVKELKKYNFKIFLDTNGDLFFKYKDLIIENVDVLGLPIDFLNDGYRASGSLNNILNILDFFKDTKKKLTIRIGTVITKDNFNDIEKIGNLIKNYPVDIWKIYEFIPVEGTNAVKNKPLLEVSSREFNEITQKIKKKFSKYFKIVISKRKDRTNAYFLVASDGTVFMPMDDLNICKEIKIGNVFDKNIVKKWKNFFSEDKYINNAKATFNYKF
jgi:MoaA/NifB/PqqE/SkfB family radical SAM enzyme